MGSTVSFECFNAQPTLIGPTLRLRPLRAEDREPMRLAAADPFIWELHPARDRHLREVFLPYFEERLATGCTLAAVDLVTGEVIGMSGYAPVADEHASVEIGFTFLCRSHWGGVTNAEMKRLMIDHAARSFDRVVFRIAETNLRSSRAVEKIGAVLRPDKATTSDATGAPWEHVVYELPTHHRPIA